MKIRRRVVVLCLLGMAFVVAAALELHRRVQSARRTATRCTCISQLKMLGLALSNYQLAYGCFPPPYTVDKAGKPMHSWRVLILPFIEQDDLYSRYRFDEPWNGPHNRQLVDLMPRIFRCPEDKCNHPLRTSYLAVVGPRAGWEAGRALKDSDFTDDTSHTIQLCEVAESDICWTEPRDLTLDEAVAGVNADAALGIRSHHRGGANCVFAHGFPGWLYDGISNRILKGLLTRDGGENVSQFFLEDRQASE